MDEPRPRVRILSDAEIEALPEEIREHYREHNWIRHMDDLEYFPARTRDVFLGLAERGRARSLARIAERERRQAS